jgi:hypothetical protein
MLNTAGDWAVVDSFKQRDVSAAADWWKLIAINLTTGKSLTLASANARPMTDQAPQATISDDKIVWDELLADGKKVIKLHDLQTSGTRTLPLPASVYPTQPFLSGNRVVFLDTSTDPAPNTAWFFAGGTVSTLDLITGSFAHLRSSPPNASLMSVHGDRFTWTDSVKDPRFQSGSVFQLHLGYLDDRPGEVIGYGSGRLSGDYILRDDNLIRALVITSLRHGTTTIFGWPHRGPETFAPSVTCGDRLYFALRGSDTQGEIRMLQLSP